LNLTDVASNLDSSSLSADNFQLSHDICARWGVHGQLPITWRCLAGMLKCLNPTTLRSYCMWLIMYYSNFQTFLLTHFLWLAELEHWLADVEFFP